MLRFYETVLFSFSSLSPLCLSDLPVNTFWLYMWMNISYVQCSIRSTFYILASMPCLALQQLRSSFADADADADIQHLGDGYGWMDLYEKYGEQPYKTEAPRHACAGITTGKRRRYRPRTRVVNACSNFHTQPSIRRPRYIFIFLCKKYLYIHDFYYYYSTAQQSFLP